MQLFVLFDFAGRLHPAIVHLPIGILLLACLFELFIRSNNYISFRPAIQTMIFWGMVTAVAAVVSGLMLEGSGEYEEEFVEPHQWVGISAAVLCILLYILYRKKVKRNIIKIFSAVVLLMISITGHLGGNITRGPEFLTEPFNQTHKTVTIKPIPNIQQAVAFNDVVQPILKEGCYNCHGPNKHKGKLRFDEKEAIIKGGKTGKTIVAGKPEESELIKRLLLPLDHEDHMPPKSKAQLTREQISVLQWWVNAGADFNKKVSDLKQSENIKPVLLALETGIAAPDNEITEIPDEPVEAGDSAVIHKLVIDGVMLMPLARNSNYLSASFVTVAGKADSLLKSMVPLKRQIITLKLDHANITDSTLTTVAELDKIRRLQLSNTNITDKGLMKLKKLKDLGSLNLVGTKVTAKGLIEMRNLKKLKYVYLYKTSITAEERAELKKSFPDTILDFGNYSLPMLVTDTTEININQ
ncbi:MAG TPA: c-type cytochrome domain-containing protein [Flavitalea sp.]|nr:c-type cytochrome domain-containing protein [Flavitalea sp.]